MANGLNLIKAIIEASGCVLKWIWQVFVAFLPLWDINKWTICFIIFLILTIGTFCSKSEKKKLWMAICSIFDIISLICAINLK